MARIVVALGGNAILSNDASADEQKKAVRKTAKELVRFVENGDSLIITHGNGPQVGNLLLQQMAADDKKNPAMPLDTCGAMTQGSIGYWFQNAMQEQLKAAGIDKNVVSIVTQTIVNENDDAFNNPSKPIGPFYQSEDLNNIEQQHPDWQMMEDAGRGYRRAVPSPQPVAIEEYPAIRKIVDVGIIPIVAGGGGIPVVEKSGQLVGTEAVIDKDFSAAKIAELVDADKLIILTSVGGVFYNFGKPNQEEIFDVSVDEVQKHIDADEFSKGSMMPKVKAAVHFVQSTGSDAIIGALDDVKEIIEGTKGTVIHA
jgi:carbamate kinase